MNESIPPHYLGLNTFTFLCCCFLFGLIGLVYGIQVYHTVQYIIVMAWMEVMYATQVLLLWVHHVPSIL